MKQKSPKEKIRLVFTGGHAGATAYALVQEIRRQNKPWEIYWIGPKKAMEGTKTITYEQHVFPGIGIKYYPIVAGRIQRIFSLWTIPSLLKIPVGFFHSLILLVKIRPKIIVSFGGYASFPVVVVGWFLRVPIILHEQTFSFGRAAKLSSFFAKKIALARKESRRFFPEDKCVVTGNPVAREIGDIPFKGNVGNPPVIFFVGGSRGSETINNLLLEILPGLLGKYKVIHQIGELQFEKFKKVRQDLGIKEKSRYEIYDFIHPKNWYKYLSMADLVVSRSGANMVAEVILAKKPAIFVPIPFTFMDEQTQNAQSAAGLGFAKVLNQNTLVPDALYAEIENTFKNLDSILKNAEKSESLDEDASKKLLNLIDEEITN